MSLSDLAARRAKPRAASYKLTDAAGLSLIVRPSGSKSWGLRYRFGGSDKTLTIGRYPEVTLAKARKARDDARELLREGTDPAKHRDAENEKSALNARNTFEAVAADWIDFEAKEAGWTEHYRKEVSASLRNHLSDLNPRPVAEITAAVASPALRKVAASAPDMAKKVGFRLRAILDYAVEHGIIAGNPIPAPRRRRRASPRKHLPALLDSEAVGGVLRAADKAEVGRGVRRAHLFAAFTAQRIGEIVPAEWSEIDLAAGTWTIPRERMKRKDAERGPHDVPIPPVLLRQLKDWKRADGEGAKWVCPAPFDDRPITREAVEKFYRRGLALSGKHSPHSWRSVFSTWARDAGKDGDAIEAQLDHVIGTKVQSAYDRAKRLELRRPLLAWYEARLLAARDGKAATVTSIRRAKGAR
jgi:integrase